MCDYSLESQMSRSAKAGDRLVTTGFFNSSTRGFCAADARDVAVCLLPGIELAFDRPVNCAVSGVCYSRPSSMNRGPRVSVRSTWQSPPPITTLWSWTTAALSFSPNCAKASTRRCCNSRQVMQWAKRWKSLWSCPQYWRSSVEQAAREARPSRALE